ncbi:hypothetical protein AB3N60_05250 [Leptospira sp. WS39.C2]
MKKYILFVCTAFLFTNSALRSETIQLKSGEKIEGSVLAQDKDTVTIKLADGNTKVYPKSLIRKVSFAKKSDPTVINKEPQVSEKERKLQEEKELTEKQKRIAEDLKAKEEKQKQRDGQISNAKRHYFEGSFGVGNGENQSELRPFFQTIQIVGLLFGGGGQAELQSTPYKTKHQSATTRLFYSWNRFTFEIRGTEARGNFNTSGFQTLSYGSGSSSSSDKTTNILLGSGETKFQKLSSRIGFTPFPHPLFDFQILAGVERIWTKTSQEVDSLGGITTTGLNPNRISYRETSNPLRGFSIGIGYEWKFLERFSLQGQILHLDLQGPSTFRSNEFSFDASPFKFRQFGLDYQWKSTGTEVNLKFSTKLKEDLSFFVEASNLVLKNKMGSGYITENDGGGDSDLSQILVKVYAPKILIPTLLDSKTVLTYVQVGANYRFNF